MFRFFAAIAIVILALFLQFFLASAGWYFNITLAVLIASAFVFSFLELLVLDLLAVFILNWQPAPSIAIIVFALVPLAAFAFRKVTRWHGWIGSLIAIAAGFLIFYFAAAPGELLPNAAKFLEDMVIGLIAGELVFFAMQVEYY
jgi:hypothetical protein